MKCETCGIEFEAQRATARYCSTSCRVKASRISVTQSEAPSPLSVTVKPLSNDFSVTDEAAEVGTPAKVIDLVKDLHLDLKKDLGIDGWTADGIFIKPDITVYQVQNIAHLIHAKYGRPCPEFRQQGI
jgi:hypothetical protein